MKSSLTLILCLMLAMAATSANARIAYPTDSGEPIEVGSVIKICGDGTIVVCDNNDFNIMGIVSRVVTISSVNYYEIENNGLVLARVHPDVVAGDLLTTGPGGILRKAESGEIKVGFAVESGHATTLRRIMLAPDYRVDFDTLGFYAQLDTLEEFVSIDSLGAYLDTTNSFFQQLRADGSVWLTDQATLVSGANITLTQSNDTVTIAATGGGGADTDWTRATNYVHTFNTADSVGIGTDSPTEKLDVVGNANISGYIIADTISSPLDTLYLPDKVWMDELVTDSIEARGDVVKIRDALSIQDSLYFDGAWRTGWPTSGLTNFTESNYSYDSKYGVKLTPNSAQTNVDFVIQPKGNGAIIANQPDGTSAGGNKRGVYAIDLQIYRNNASQVASGDYSAILGGGANSSQGFASVVIGGANNIASGSNSLASGLSSDATGNLSLAMGKDALASNEYAVAIGNNPIASGYASLAMGDYTRASGRISTALGNRTTAPSAYETVLGRYNSDYTPASATDWILTDRLFVVGNGASDVAKSNALTILKNGNTGIGTDTPTQKLEVNGSVLLPTGSSYWIGNAGDTGNRLRLHQSGTNAYVDWGEDNLLFRSGSGSPSNKVVFTSDGKVGISTSTPRAALDLGLGITNRKLILYTTVDNDHQFSGLGINTDALRYQIANTAGNHKFYAATSATTSNELFRIQGNGQIVIPALTTAGVLLNSSSGVIGSTIGTAGQVLTTNGTGGVSWATAAVGDGHSLDAADGSPVNALYVNNEGYVGIGTTAPASRLTLLNNVGDGFNDWTDYQVLLFTAATPQASYGIGVRANTLAFNSDSDYDFDQDGSTVMTIQSGKVGIGTVAPKGLLDLGNSVANRKIVLYTGTDNDHEYSGFGINYDAMRYQIANTGASHKFYAGTSSTTSTELFRIQGNGQIAIPAMTTAGVLLNSSSGVISSTKGTADQMLKMNSAGTATEWASESDPSVPEGTTPGQMQYWNGTAWVTVEAGEEGQFLRFIDSTPTWVSVSEIDFLEIGDYYQGGIIAYFLQPGDPGYDPNVRHGLIVTQSDQSTAAEWGCNGTTISGADGTSIGTGQQNTLDIIAGCSTAGIAARICNDLVFNGYSDWYLPSIVELSKVYLNRTAIGGFSGVEYWSSSEHSAFGAKYFHFGGGMEVISNKNNLKFVRAVRAF